MEISTLHPINLATRVFGFMLLCVWGYSPANAEQKVLDLTKQSALEIHTMGVPGDSVGGIAGNPRTRAYELPLRLKIKQYQVIENSISVELQLTNIGRVPISVPACLDGHKAFQTGTRAHRSLEIGISVASESAHQHVAEPIETTFGSSGMDCTIELAPDDTLLVILHTLVPKEVLELGKSNFHTSTSISVAEIRFEDDRYIVRTRSMSVQSGPIAIDWGKN